MRKEAIFVVGVLLAFLGDSFSTTALAQEAKMNEVAELVLEKESGLVAGQSFLAPINSKSDLEKHIQSHKVSPLDYLSPRSSALFLESLVFTKNGLASYRYKEIERELTPRQATELLSLFGVQGTIFQMDFVKASSGERLAMEKLRPVLYEDHKGYRCAPPATCEEAMGRICIGANCGMIP